MRREKLYELSSTYQENVALKKVLVYCAAINCTNSSSKKSDNTFSFFKLPKDSNRGKGWIATIKKSYLPKDKNLQVCHEHFQENCFQRDLRVSYIFLIGCLLEKYVKQNMFSGSAKVLKREGSIAPSSFYGQLSDFSHKFLTLSTQWMSSPSSK